MKSTNVVWHDHYIKKEDRNRLKNQKPCVLWFTGLSASGKSSIANAVEAKLFKLNKHTYLLDGDNVRHGINKDLGFSDEDRIENIRRIGEMAKLFVDSGIIVLTAFISPFKEDRNRARKLVEKNEFIEVFIDTPIEICEQRDPKGLYVKARKGEIKDFTGIGSVYEEPVNPEIRIKTADLSIDACADLAINYLKDKGHLDAE